MVSREADTTGPKTVENRAKFWVVTLSGIIWVALLARIIPDLDADRGIFASVAERLLAGDRLYSEVWDNKDPLFFYSLALVRWVSPYGDFVLELAWLVIAALSIREIARNIGCWEPIGSAVALIATPIILTGQFYYAGYTHLPGTAITLATFAATLAQRYKFAGILLAILFLLKITTFPVAFVIMMVVIGSRGDWRNLGRLMVGLSISALTALGLLLYRGELEPYLRSLKLNASYSNSALTDSGRWPIVEHLIRVTSSSSLTVILGCVAVLLFGLSIRRVAEIPLKSREDWIMWVATAAALIMSVVVLALTGLADHHNQVLYIPAALCVLLLARWAQSISPIQPVTAIAALAVISLSISATNPVVWLISYHKAPSTIADSKRVPAEAAALLAVAGASGSYARFGSNDDGGHANGLSDWRLGCARFHQYSFLDDDTLQTYLSCITTVDAVIVSSGSTAQLLRTETMQDPLRGYARLVSDKLNERFDCTRVSAVTICLNRIPNSPIK